MAHGEQQEFIGALRGKFPDSFKNKKVLEVGSLDINGTVRVFYENCDYLGIDVGQGRGVDLVCEGQKYDGPDESFDNVISCECMEHNPFWVETFANMIRVCKSEGLLIMTCATDGRPEHGTSRSHPGCSPLTVGVGWEYYHNLNEADFRAEFEFDNLFSSYEFSVNTTSKDLYFWGVKK